MPFKNVVGQLKNEFKLIKSEIQAQRNPSQPQSQPHHPQQHHQQPHQPPPIYQPARPQPPGNGVYWRPRFEQSAAVTAEWDAQIGNGVDGWGNQELEHYTALPQNVF